MLLVGGGDTPAQALYPGQSMVHSGPTPAFQAITSAAEMPGFALAIVSQVSPELTRYHYLSFVSGVGLINGVISRRVRDCS